MKNVTFFTKISLISSLSAGILAAALFVVPGTALAGYGNSYGNSYNHGGYSGGYGGHYSEPTYYPVTHTPPATTGGNTVININNNISGYTQPVYYSQPQVIYTQPIYEQQPIVYSQPVYQQPVYEQPSYSSYAYSGYAPTYYQDYNTATPLNVSCSANETFAPIGSMVLWSASVTGGSGAYDYSWSGSDQIYGSNSTANVSYNTTGQKYAAVTVYSNGQNITVNCSNTVTVGTQNYSNGYSNGISGSLAVGCAADSKTVAIGTPVTWSVEATGGNGGYSYSWTGTDGLSGSQTSVSTDYETAGSKSASVTVTSGGQTVTENCGSSVTVVALGTPINNQLGYRTRGTGTSGVATAVKSNGNTNTLAANLLFSLGNIPWGWVAVLIILVLFGTVLYLLFNKHKI